MQFGYTFSKGIGLYFFRLLMKCIWGAGVKSNVNKKTKQIIYKNPLLTKVEQIALKINSCFARFFLKR